jgi:hypothetical protein
MKNMISRISRPHGMGIASALALLVGSAVAATATSAEEAKPVYRASMAPVNEYLMDRDAEIALAKSAAPPEISSDATVLVMTKKGYETAIKGKNGFVCLVERSFTAPFSEPGFWNTRGTAPMCMNAPAARSALPVNIKRTELALAGLDKQQILARLKELIVQKAFPALEIGSMSYMLSKDQYVGEAVKHWHPHLMFYMPGDMPASAWSANLPGWTTVYGGAEELPGGGYLPWTLFFVPVPKWSDGTPDQNASHAH